MRVNGYTAPMAKSEAGKKVPGLYSCVMCRSALFSTEAEFDGAGGYRNFRESINVRNVEFRKNPSSQGEIRIRCKKCQSPLGSIVGGKNPYYRVHSDALESADGEESAEEEEHSVESFRIPEESRGLISSDARDVVHAVAGGIVGLLIGAGGMFLL